MPFHQVLRADRRLLGLPLDLVRCESLQSLDPATCGRLLTKNYWQVCPALGRGRGPGHPGPHTDGVCKASIHPTVVHSAPRNRDYVVHIVMIEGVCVSVYL